MYAFAQNALKVPPAKFNFAKRIDTRLVDPLGELPPGSFGRKQPPQDPLVANLAFRNLERAEHDAPRDGPGHGRRSCRTRASR